MADYNSSLPVRTQNNGDLKINVADGTTESQLMSVDASGRLTVKLDDGSGNIITSQINGTQRALDVGIDVAGVQVDPRQIRTLTTTDSISIGSALPAGTNLIGGANVYYNSTAVTTTNPLPVSISDQTAGTPIQNYQTAVNLAAGSTVTLTYTVASGHTFTLQQMIASGTGKIRADFQISGSTVNTQFGTASNPNVPFVLQTAPTIAAAGTVGAIIKNEDLSPFDVFLTIEGNQN